MESSYQSYDDQLIASLSEIAESENETTSNKNDKLYSCVAFYFLLLNYGLIF